MKENAPPAGASITPHQRTGIALCALLALVIAYLGVLGRAGAGINLLGLPIGALLTPVPSVFCVAFLLSRPGKALFHSLDATTRRVYYAVAFAVIVALLRGLSQAQFSLLHFRDMAYVLHLPWILVAMLAGKTASRRQMKTLIWVVASTLIAVVALHLLRPSVETVDNVYSWLSIAAERAGSDKPEVFLKSGDIVVLSLSLAALTLHDPVKRMSALAALSSAFLGVLLARVSLTESRGSALGLLLGIGCVSFAHRNRTRIGTALIGSFFLGVLVFSLSMLASSNYDENYDNNSNRRALTQTVVDIRGDIDRDWNPTGNISFRGRNWNPTGTIGWRIFIWRDVVVEWNATWATRLFGIGFGKDLQAMTVSGRQGYDGLNRGVHNIAITILGRQGLLGLTAFAAVILSLLKFGATSTGVVFPVLLAALVIALFDVFFESAHSPILTWIMVGLLISLPVTE